MKCIKRILICAALLGFLIGMSIAVYQRFKKAQNFKNQYDDTEITVLKCFLSFYECCNQRCLEENDDCMIEISNHSFCKNKMRNCVNSCDK